MKCPRRIEERAGDFFMREYYFLLGSVTTAIRGETVLKKLGYKAYVRKDSSINPHGCGYVIRVFGDKETLEGVFRRNGIRYYEVKEAI